MEEREILIKNTIDFIANYPSLQAQTNLFIYAMHLFDFSHGSSDFIEVNSRADDLGNIYFIILKDDKVIEISNQLLL